MLLQNRIAYATAEQGVKMAGELNPILTNVTRDVQQLALASTTMNETIDKLCRTVLEITQSILAMRTGNAVDFEKAIKSLQSTLSSICFK